MSASVGKSGAAQASAEVLFKSVEKLYRLPDFVQVWPAHGAGSACGKVLGAVPVSTIGYERRFSPAIRAATDKQKFLEYILAGQPEPPLYFARMKRQNREGPRILGSLPEPRELTGAELLAINTRKDVLIDTRPWAEFRNAHISGSFFHPLNRGFVTDIGAMVGENPNIYVICKRSEQQEIIRRLVRIGLDNVKGFCEPSVLSAAPANSLRMLRSNEVTGREIQNKIECKSVHVLDVRRKVEYDDGHICGAQNIVHTRLAAKLNEVPKDKPLAVYCSAGGRSVYACALLERAGFDVVNLQGGILDWEKSGFPVVRD